MDVDYLEMIDIFYNPTHEEVEEQIKATELEAGLAFLKKRLELGDEESETLVKIMRRDEIV